MEESYLENEVDKITNKVNQLVHYNNQQEIYVPNAKSDNTK